MNISIHMDDHLPGHPLTNEVPLITIGTLGFGLLPLSFEAGKAFKLRTLRFDYPLSKFYYGWVSFQLHGVSCCRRERTTSW